MNGRVYDPKLGRMLSPDPVTQAPENGQNYNRYSYAYNNPLKYTDPSGYESEDTEPNSDWIFPSDSYKGGSSRQYNHALLKSVVHNLTIGFRTKFAAAYEKYGLEYGDWQGLFAAVGDNTSGGTPDGQSTVVGTVDQANPAQAVVDEALKDGHITFREANQIWRANTDPGLKVIVDAGQLRVEQTGGFNKNGVARAKVVGTGDWLVHGSVRIKKTADGSIKILQDSYDFKPNPRSWYNSGAEWRLRNFETYGGYWWASGGGNFEGTDYNIVFEGSPVVIPQAQE